MEGVVFQFLFPHLFYSLCLHIEHVVVAHARVQGGDGDPSSVHLLDYWIYSLVLQVRLLL